MFFLTKKGGKSSSNCDVELADVAYQQVDAALPAFAEDTVKKCPILACIYRSLIRSPIIAPAKITRTLLGAATAVAGGGGPHASIEAVFSCDTSGFSCTACVRVSQLPEPQMTKDTARVVSLNPLLSAGACLRGLPCLAFFTSGLVAIASDVGADVVGTPGTAGLAGSVEICVR